jgi:hypothetical protein
MGDWRYSPTILDLGTRWKWVVHFKPQTLYHRGRVPGTHWIGGSVGPKAGMDAVEQTDISSPCRESTPAVQPVARRYTAWDVKGSYNCSGFHTLHNGVPQLSKDFIARYYTVIIIIIIIMISMSLISSLLVLILQLASGLLRKHVNK